MQAYEQAKRDSLRINDEKRHDPFFRKDSTFGNSKLQDFSINGINSNDPLVTSRKISEKLAQLRAIVSNRSPHNDSPINLINNAGSDRIQELMSRLKTSGTNRDPDLDHIETLLDKVIQVQHGPHSEILKDSLPHKEVFSVSGAAAKEAEKGFFGPSEDPADSLPAQNTIQANIEGTQSLVSGATVKMRLMQNLFVHGVLIPKDDFVYGNCAVSGERLKIAVNSLRCGVNIYPVSLEVFDMDGLAGIYIPGSIDRDVSKQSADAGVSSMGITDIDPTQGNSFGFQAANAGIQMAKTLTSRKLRLVRVNVPSGYQVLLRDMSRK
jgi:hypothetical protein